jgi:hypothetical protein
MSSVHGAVHLDHHPGGMAVEVGDVAIDDLLPAEVEARELVRA